jgi:hypothetical protein
MVASRQKCVSSGSRACRINRVLCETFVSGQGTLLFCMCLNEDTVDKTIDEVCVRRIDPSALVTSLSSHRHSYIR